jgi:hypothetical protein
MHSWLSSSPGGPSSHREDSIVGVETYRAPGFYTGSFWVQVRFGLAGSGNVFDRFAVVRGLLGGGGVESIKKEQGERTACSWDFV